jgi:hypothetical protein
MIASAIPTRWTLTLAAWLTMAVCALIVPASAAEPERAPPSASQDSAANREDAPAPAEHDAAAQPAEDPAPAAQRPHADAYRVATVFPDAGC